MPAEGSAPSQTSVLSVKDNGTAGSVLSTTAGLFALTIGKNVATTKLSISGTVVSEELRAVSTVSGRDCLPPGWTELDQIKGASSRGTMAATLTGTSDESCLRQTRSLGADEDLYGFGQVPQAGLSSVGDAKLLATSSRNQADGPSHAPAPFYVSLQGKQGLAHGVLLNTGQYSMFDIGNASKSEVRIHSPEKVMDYFLFVGPTPAKVIQQMTSVCGRSPIPPPWALGFKYHTKHSVNQEFVEATVSNFSAHKTPLAHVVIENCTLGHCIDPLLCSTAHGSFGWSVPALTP
jgi:alpha-glucosidase (family GH31 glycosyl hydrolase)